MIPQSETVLSRYVQDRNRITIPERRELKRVLEQVKNDNSYVIDRHEKSGYFSLNAGEKRKYNRLIDLENDIGYALDESEFIE